MTISNVPVQTTSADPVLKIFNQGLLDIADPTDFIGVRQPDFSIAHTYAVDNQKLQLICDELYSHVLEKLQKESVGKVKFRESKFLDYRHQSEGPRKYIIVENNTARGTKSNIFIRFLPFGDNLYVAVDSFVLGSLDGWQVFFRVILTIMPLLAVISVIGLSRFSPNSLGSIVCCFVPSLFFLFLLWIEVIRAFNQHRNFPLALRQNCNRPPTAQSFDVDDVLMFFKSSLPLVIFSVRDVFQNNDISIKTLDDFISQVNNVVNISSGGGILSIIGSAIGGNNSVVR